jgi:hypothetical protein
VSAANGGEQQREAVSERAAAKKLGLTVSRLRELVERGSLQVVRRGGARLVPLTEVRRFQGHLGTCADAARAEVEVEKSLRPARAGRSPWGLSVAEAAAELGLDVALFEVLARGGDVVSITDVGFERRVSQEEVARAREYLARRRQSRAEGGGFRWPSGAGAAERERVVARTVRAARAYFVMAQEASRELATRPDRR